MATKLDQRQAVPAAVVDAAIGAPPKLPPRQKSLFPEPILRFEMVASPRSATEAQAGVRPVRRRRTRRLERLEKAGQQKLDFDAATSFAMPTAMKSGVRSAKYCLEPVAPPLHRLVAVFLDMTMVAIGTLLFLALFRYAAGAAALSAIPVPVYGAVFAGVFLLYKSFWWLAGADTPGALWCGLRLLTFGGLRPTRAQRVLRCMGGILSIAAAGVGVAWILGDEERLGWHDYISKTFPTRREPAD